MDQECPRSEPSLSSGSFCSNIWNCICLLYFLFQPRCSYKLVEATCQEKKVWTGEKKTQTTLHDSSYVHCNIISLTRLLSPPLAKHRCLVKSVRRVTWLWWYMSEHTPVAPWLLTIAGHGSSWYRDLPAWRQPSMGCVPPEPSLRGGQGGTCKHGEGVYPGQAGACLGHYLTAGST